jgi:hypothetical protein
MTKEDYREYQLPEITCHTIDPKAPRLHNRAIGALLDCLAVVVRAGDRPRPHHGWYLGIGDIKLLYYRAPYDFRSSWSFLDAHDHDARRFSGHVIAAVETAIRFLNLAAAVHWANTSTLQVDNDLSFPRAAECLTWAWVRIAQGWAAPTAHQLHDALRLLERLSRG